MANSDTSSYTLRWNEIAKELEYGSGLNWIATGVGLVDGINQLTGDVTAGPGTGSVAATVVSAGGGTGPFSAGEISASGLTGTVQPFIFKPSSDTISAFLFTDSTGLSANSVISIDTIDKSVGINTGSTGIHQTLYVSGNIGCTETVISPNITVQQGELFVQAGYLDSQIRAASNTNGSMFQSTDTHYLLAANGSQWGVVQVNGIFAEPGTGTITPNAVSATTLDVTVTGNVTINGPTNGYDGQKLTIRVNSDASHTVTLTGGPGGFLFGTTIPSYTNTLGATDYIGVIYRASAPGWDVVSLSQGF